MRLLGDRAASGTGRWGARQALAATAAMAAPWASGWAQVPAGAAVAVAPPTGSLSRDGVLRRHDDKNAALSA